MQRKNGGHGDFKPCLGTSSDFNIATTTNKKRTKTWKTRTYLLGVWYLFPDAHENVDLSLLTTCPTREPIAGLKI